MNLIELSEAIHKRYAGWKQIDIITGNWVYIDDRLYKCVSTSSLRRLHRLINQGKRTGQMQQPLLTPTYFWWGNPKVTKRALEGEVPEMSPVGDDADSILVTR